MKTVLFASVATLAFSNLAWADEAPAPAPDVAGAEAAGVGELIVTATRSPQPADRIGQSVSVIDAKAIRASQAISLGELVATTPGVNFTRNGPVGAAAQLRIRGAETDQTLVVIDGVKVNDPSAPGGGYNFSDVLVGDVSRIEVLRGAQSTLWGSQAIGGVVNIVTAEPTSPFEGSVLAEGGSDGTAYARAAIGGAQPRVVWRLAAGRYVTDGAASAYAKGAEKDGYRNTQASGRVRLLLTDQASVDLRALYSDGRTDFDGFPAPAYSFADTAEYGTTKDFVGYAGLNLALFDGALKSRLAYGYTRTDRDNYDPTQALTDKTFDSLGENRRVEYQGVWAISEAWTATFGAEHEEAKMRSASPSSYDPNPAPDRAKASIDGVYAQAHGEVAPGLTLTAGVRHDNHDAFGGHTLGQLAAAWSLNGGDTVLRASFGQGFKAPTLYQLYGDYGNEGLEPEEADAWDAGIQQRFADGHVRVSATWFQRRSTNLIDFFTCTSSSDALCAPGGSPRFGYYANVAKASAHGIELAGEATFGALSGQANYTWTDTENRSAGANFGNELARRPKHEGNLALTYVWPLGVSTTAAVRYVGDSYDDAANATKLDAYALLDLRVSYPLNDRVELYARVENAGDEHYETISGYGAAGRTAFAGVRARF
ncbi:TonB-dependent receptor plug domain-containing protein [Phenylobacterium sp.]|uniref:TonB-dependent receptor plug domain-containing protein n=1 Tax=Phenylobacterium sp. TaxID=1871053 RepID=UPI0035B34CBF